VPLYRWLLCLVGDEPLAEDLLSEVFLDVWRQAASFEARSSVSTWLLAIARYKALSARHRRTDAELDDEVASKLADPADYPELALQTKNRQRCCADQPAGVIVAIPILPGLHHQYVRIRFQERTRHGRNGWHGLLIARSIKNKEGPGALGPF
jgi:hypothetical protein